MSIVTQALLDDPIAGTFHKKRPGDPCFYCGDPLPKPPYVLWQGIGDQIALCPACAIKLGSSLISDGTKAEGRFTPSA